MNVLSKVLLYGLVWWMYYLFISQKCSTNALMVSDTHMHQQTTSSLVGSILILGISIEITLANWRPSCRGANLLTQQAVGCIRWNVPLMKFTQWFHLLDGRLVDVIIPSFPSIVDRGERRVKKYLKYNVKCIISYRIATRKFCDYSDVIMGAMAPQNISLTMVYSNVYSGAYHRKHQSSASLAFVRGSHQWPVNSPHKWPVTRKMLPFDT